jgi:hypothetical protein
MANMTYGFPCSIASGKGNEGLVPKGFLRRSIMSFALTEHGPYFLDGSGNGPPAERGESSLLRYNQALERDCAISNLNESFLEDKLSALERCRVGSAKAYWLTVARLTELTLICAGNYADNGFLSGVGDLLFNPRLILVHVRGKMTPIAKQRHVPMTVQFAHTADTPCGVIKWLKTNTILETAKSPLLPHLVAILKSSGFISKQYLDSIAERERRVVELTCVLAGQGPTDLQDFHQWLASLSGPDRGTITSRFCRFSTSTFKSLGHDVRRLIRHGDCHSIYLDA